MAPYRAFGDAVSEWRQQRLMTRGSADEHTYVSSSEAGHVEQAYVHHPYTLTTGNLTQSLSRQTEESEGEEMAAAMEAVRVE